MAGHPPNHPLRDRVREYVDKIGDLTLLEREESGAIAKTAFYWHFGERHPKSTVLGAPLMPYWSWWYPSDGRGDLLEILTERCESDVAALFWLDWSGPVGVRGPLREVCVMVDEVDDLRFMIAGPQETWVIWDNGRKLVARGSFRLGADSMPRHCGWATVIGIAVGTIAMLAQDSLLVGAFACTVEWILSFWLFRRPRPSVLSRLTQLAFEIVLSILASLCVVLFLAKWSS